VEQAKGRARGRLAQGGVQGAIQDLDLFRSPESDFGQGAKVHAIYPAA
jgi:hypothetical protein